MTAEPADRPTARPADEPAADEPDDTARRLAQWVIIAGLALGVAAAAFLIWEAWSANRDALEHNRRQDEGEADVLPFDSGSSPAPPAKSAPPRPRDKTS